MGVAHWGRRDSERLGHHRRCADAGAPEEFTSARDAAIKAARAEKNANLARELGKLRKPTQSAWLINLLWRDQREVMEQMLQLGEELSHAQASASGPALQRLTSQRRELEAALLRRARELAQKADVTVNPQMEREAQETLAAALARPEVADEVRSGRLVKPASYAGFGELRPLATQPRGPRTRSRSWSLTSRQRGTSTRLAPGASESVATPPNDALAKRGRTCARRRGRWKKRSRPRRQRTSGTRICRRASSRYANNSRSSKRRPPRSNARRSTQRAVASTPNARTPLPSAHSSAPNRS
jgi:hypothetical protein